MVQVDRSPRAPRLTGNYSQDINVLHTCIRELCRTVEQLRERTGGSTDSIATNTETANNASATASAAVAGATVPASGGAVELNPANPLSYALVSETEAAIVVAGHTRTGAASPLVGANATPNATRGSTAVTYYVYYADAGNVGGAQSYLWTASLATVTATAGYRIIGTIVIPKMAYSDRELA